MKVFACSGNDAGSSCDVQTFNGAQSLGRGPAPRGQVMQVLQACHLQTLAEEKAPAQQASSNGISVGDSVEVITASGWTPAKVIAIQGNNYRVSTYGVQVTKTYPAEVRRVGATTARDHAAGQYRLGDQVQVNVNGQWMDGKIVVENGMEYQVQFGNRTVWAAGNNLRPSPPRATKGNAAAGGPPQPGMTRCGAKLEGRYASSGLGSATITFRSGKATMSNGFSEDTLECWTAGAKIILRQSGHPELDMPIDINNDGTLQMPLFGELKKKGN
jgi:hypothetical protein